MGIRFVGQSELARDTISRDFVGRDFGGVGACVIFVDAGPGERPRLHRHPYGELLIVREGTATFPDGEPSPAARKGEMTGVDWNQPHRFPHWGRARAREST